MSNKNVQISAQGEQGRGVIPQHLMKAQNRTDDLPLLHYTQYPEVILPHLTGREGLVS